MGDDAVLVRPGIPDINGQFTARKKTASPISCRTYQSGGALSPEIVIV
jgi:hypothetical protein